MDRLLELLRGHDVDLLHDQEEWEQVFALAEEERILPWVARLCNRQTAVDPNLRNRLKAIERDAAIAAFYWSSELKAILRAFEQQDIMVVPLKGPFLAERLCGEAALRVSYDLDLLVAKSDVDRAEAVFSGLRFIPDTPDDYHRAWWRGRTTIELHHDVENPLAFDFHIASVLRRTQPTAFQGQRCWQLAPGDELLFLCLHGVRHCFERLSLIQDLCLAFENLNVAEQAPADSNIQQIAERTSLLVLGLAMARRLQPDMRVRTIEGASAAQVDHLEGVADRLWHRLLTQTSEPLDWQSQHAFFLEMELPGHRLRRRWRHFQILSARVIKPDYEFAAGFGCHRVWQVRLLRPLRILRDAIQNRSHTGG